jgi:hypothetical protein
MTNTVPRQFLTPPLSHLPLTTMTVTRHPSPHVVSQEVATP